MAGFFDVCSLLLTSAFFLGAIFGTAYMVRKCRALIDTTKASLEKRGLVLAPEGDDAKGGRDGGEGSKTVVVIRTSKKWRDQERYLDATQRGVMNILHTSTFGDPQTAHPADPSASLSSGGASGSNTAESSSSREKVRRMRDHLMSRLYGV